MKTLTALLTAKILKAIAFAPGDAGWKLDKDGKIELKDGNPIYIDAEGKEMTIEAGTVSRLNAEAAGHRRAKEAAETKLKEFEGLDAKKAREALDTVSKIDQKKLIDAGEVDKVKDEISKQFTTQIAEKDKANNDLQSKLDNMQIDNIFSNSEFIRERIATPRDMFQDSFRKFFKKDGNEIIAVDRAGNRLMSKQRIGEFATPEEALELLVDTHPQKDTILRADTGKGSGNGGNGGARGGGRVMKRSEFNALAPAQQAEAGAKQASGELQIVD